MTFSNIARDTSTVSKLKPATREKLKQVSTASICTALFKRGLRTQMIQDVRPLNPNVETMVGEAFTLRYIPAREDLNPISVFTDRSHPQRKGVEDCPPGAVFVIDSRKDARAASAGGILVTRLMKRGCAGIVTDGGFRDSAEIAKLAMPAYPQSPSRADEPDAASGDRHQRSHWLRRCARLARRHHRRRRRRRRRHSRRHRR